MNLKYTILTSSLLLCAGPLMAQQSVVTFESLPLPTSPGFYNGDTNAMTPLRDAFQTIGSRDNFGAEEIQQFFEVDGVKFFNGYTPNFGSFNGFASSNIVDVTTPGFENQFASFAGGGSDGNGGVAPGDNYLVGFGGLSIVNLPNRSRIDSIDITSTTFTALSIRNGDAFSEAFEDGDFFSVTITGLAQRIPEDLSTVAGLTSPGGLIPDDLDLFGSTGSQEFFLADYRNGQTLIRDTWETLDLSALGAAEALAFSFNSTDSGTPAYAAIDNLTFTTAVPEPSSLLFLSLVSTTLISFRRKRA